MTRITTCSAILASALASAAFAGGTTIEIIASTSDASVPGFPSYVWLPNAFGNPTIGDNGVIYFTGKLGGADITTANARVVFWGQPGALELCGRDGSPAPAGAPAGAVFNTTSGINGLSSSTVCAPNGTALVSGNINYAGAVATTDTMCWVGSPGAWAPVAHEGDPAPGTAGATLTQSMSLSSMKVNNNGEFLLYSSLANGDTVTTNNAAVYKAGPAGLSMAMRKGDAVPGLADGTLMGAIDSFNHYINGAGEMVFTGTLLVGSGGVTANDDKVIMSTRGGLHVVAREGQDIPGHTGLQFLVGGTFSTAARTFHNDGSTLFWAGLQGTGVDTTNNGAIFVEKDGVYTIIMRKGDALSDGTLLSSPNFTSYMMTDTGHFCMQGITTETANNTFVAAGQIGSPLTVIAKQGAQVPGAAEGVFYGSLNGSTNIAMNNRGQVYFKNTITGAVTTLDNEVQMGWDATNGLYTIVRKGDAFPTGGALSIFTALGSTAQNGEGTSTCLSSTGWLSFNAKDVNNVYIVGRVQLLDPTPACTGDLDGNGTVDGADLGAVLGGWGGAGGDVDGDGTTGGADLASLLSNWGDC